MSWGVHTILDLTECNAETIRSADKIKEFIDKLIISLQMKPFGAPVIVKFGDDPKVEGYTFIQMIETSLISGHLVDIDNSAHIDVFSCKDYDVPSLLYFTKEFFEAKNCKWQVIPR